MAQHWGLIADDLTGACDAGVQFAKHGFPTTVWLSEEFVRVEPGALAVITTNTRRSSSAEARAKTMAACRVLAGLGAQVVYAKIDSTFNGHPGVQITAVMEACGFTLALVCPAFPDMGRTVNDGRLEVSGWSRPVPLPALLKEQGVDRVYELRRPDAAQLRTMASAGPSVVILDAVSQQDLAEIAEAARRISPAPLLAGSAGLATEVASLLAAEGQPGGAQVCAQATGLGPVVLCIGSTNPVTEQQVRLLTGGLLENRGTTRISAWPAMKDRALGCGNPSSVPVLHQPASTGEHRPPGPILLIRVDSRFSDPLPDMRALQPRGLVLTGGDTALHVLRSLDIAGIRLRREVLPGIPWGTLIGGPLDGLPVVTKAGGFGPPDALVRVVDFLSTLGNESE